MKMNPLEVSSQSGHGGAPPGAAAGAQGYQQQLEQLLMAFLGRRLDTRVNFMGLAPGGLVHPKVKSKPLPPEVFDEFLESCIVGREFGWEELVAFLVKYNGHYATLTVERGYVKLRFTSDRVKLCIPLCSDILSRAHDGSFPPIGTVFYGEVASFSPSGLPLGFTRVTDILTCMVNFPVGSVLSIDDRRVTISSTTVPYARFFAFKMCIPGCFLSLRDELDLINAFISKSDQNYFLRAAEALMFNVRRDPDDGQVRFTSVLDEESPVMTVAEIEAKLLDMANARSLEGFVAYRGNMATIRQQRELLPFEQLVGSKDQSYPVLLRRLFGGDSLYRGSCKLKPMWDISFLGKVCQTTDGTRSIALFEERTDGTFRFVCRLFSGKELHDSVSNQMYHGGLDVHKIPHNFCLVGRFIEKHLEDFAENIDADEKNRCVVATVTAVFPLRPRDHETDDRQEISLGAIKQVKEPLKPYDPSIMLRSIEDVCGSSSHWRAVQTGGQEADKVLKELRFPTEFRKKLDPEALMEMNPGHQSELSPIVMHDPRAASRSGGGAAGSASGAAEVDFKGMRLFFSFKHANSRSELTNVIKTFTDRNGERITNLTTRAQYIASPPGIDVRTAKQLSKFEKSVIDVNYIGECIVAGRILPLEDRHILYSAELEYRRGVAYLTGGSVDQAGGGAGAAAPAPAPAPVQAHASPAVDRGRARSEENSPPEVPPRRRQAVDMGGGAARSGSPIYIDDDPIQEAPAAAPQPAAAPDVVVIPDDEPAPVADGGAAAGMDDSQDNQPESPILVPRRPAAAVAPAAPVAAPAVLALPPPSLVVAPTRAPTQWGPNKDGIFKGIIFVLMNFGPVARRIYVQTIQRYGGGVRYVADGDYEQGCVGVYAVVLQRELTQAKMREIIAAGPRGMRIVDCKFINQCDELKRLVDWVPYDVFREPYPDQIEAAVSVVVAPPVAPAPPVPAVTIDEDETQAEGFEPTEAYGGGGGSSRQALIDELGNPADISVDIFIGNYRGKLKAYYWPHTPEILATLPGHQVFADRVRAEMDLFQQIKDATHSGSGEDAALQLMRLHMETRQYISDHPEVLRLYPHRSGNTPPSSPEPSGGAPGGVEGSSLLQDEEEPAARSPSPRAIQNAIYSSLRRGDEYCAGADFGGDAARELMDYTDEAARQQYEQFDAVAPADEPAAPAVEDPAVENPAAPVVAPPGASDEPEFDDCDAVARDRLSYVFGAAVRMVISTRRVRNWKNNSTHPNNEAEFALAKKDSRRYLLALCDSLNNVNGHDGVGFSDVFVQELSLVFDWESMIDRIDRVFKIPPNTSVKLFITVDKLRSMLRYLHDAVVDDKNILTAADVDAACNRVLGSIDWTGDSPYSQVRLRVAQALRASRASGGAGGAV